MEQTPREEPIQDPLRVNHKETAGIGASQIEKEERKEADSLESGRGGEKQSSR